MEIVLSGLSKELKDQRKFAICLLLYSILLIFLGWCLFDCIGEKSLNIDAFCPNTYTIAPIIFVPFAFSKSKDAVLLLAVSVKSVSFGFCANAILDLLLTNMASRPILLLFFFFVLQNVLELSLLIHCTLALLSHVFMGITATSKRTFLLFCLFYAGVWFTFDFLYNFVISFFFERIYNAFQSI